MTREERERLAALAREVGRASRYGPGPPLLADDAGREVCRWLMWCDPNGTHAMVNHDPNDSLCARGQCACEGYENDAEAWEGLAEMLAEV